MKKDGFVKVNASKSGNGYLDYRVRLPREVVEGFCLKKDQELKLDLDFIKQRIILSLKFEDIPSHEEITKIQTEKSIKKKKDKMLSSAKIGIEKDLHYVKNSKHKDKKEIIKYLKNRLKQLKK